jgi:hypothetical protein
MNRLLLGHGTGHVQPSYGVLVCLNSGFPVASFMVGVAGAAGTDAMSMMVGCCCLVCLQGWLEHGEEACIIHVVGQLCK